MKKIILIMVPLVLIAGTVFGLAFFNVIHIPGISPVKKKVVVKNERTIPMLFRSLVSMGKKLPDPNIKPVLAKPDTKKAEEKLAELWSQLDAEKLAEITASWSETDLAPILNRMDLDKQTKLFAAMEPDRAAAVFQAIKKLLTVNPAKS